MRQVHGGNFNIMDIAIQYIDISLKNLAFQGRGDFTDSGLAQQGIFREDIDR